MTVGELIKELEKFPKDKQIWLLTINGCEFESACMVAYSLEDEVVISS